MNNIKIIVLAIGVFVWPASHALAGLYGEFFEKIKVKPTISLSSPSQIFKGLALIKQVKTQPGSFQLQIAPLQGQCDNNGYCQLVMAKSLTAILAQIDNGNTAEKELSTAAKILGSESKLANRLIWLDARRPKGSSHRAWSVQTLKVIREDSREYFDKVVTYGASDISFGDELSYHVLIPDYGYRRQYDLDWASVEKYF